VTIAVVASVRAVLPAEEPRCRKEFGVLTLATTVVLT
jgi:hypothetical protein